MTPATSGGTSRPLDPRLEAVAKALHAHRVSRGLSVRELAVELGISYSTVSRVESCTNAPDVPTLLCILDHLELTGIFFNADATAAGGYLRGWNDCAAMIRGGLDRVPSDNESNDTPHRHEGD